MTSVARWLAGMARPLHTACALVLLVGAGAALVWPHNSSFVFRQPLVWGATVLALSGWWMARRRPLFTWPTSSRAHLLPAAGLSVVAGLLAACSRYAYEWDARLVVKSARFLSADDPLPPGLLRYFSRYPNNLPLLTLDTTMFRLAHALHVPVSSVIIGLNTVCMFGTLCALSVVGRWMAVPRSVVPVQLVFFVIVGSSPVMTVPYTDLPACCLCALSILCVITVVRSPRLLGRLVAASAAGILLGLALVFKPYTLVLACGLAVSGAVFSGRLVRRRDSRTLLAVPLAGLLCLGTMSGANALSHRVTGLSDQELRAAGPAMSPVHFIQMGLHDLHDPKSTRVWGGYDAKSVVEMIKIPDPAARERFVEKTLRDELRAQRVGGTAWFLANKLVWLWGDGTLWTQGEGHDRMKRPDDPNPVASVTMQTGRFFPYKAALTQGLWIALLIITGVRLIRRKPSFVSTWLATSLLGVTTYLLLFEGRPRYLIAMLPALLVLVQILGPRGQARDGSSPPRRFDVRRALYARHGDRPRPVRR